MRVPPLRLAILALIALLLAACRAPPQHMTVARGQVAFIPAHWSDLPGWEDDAVSAAWPAVLSSCRVHSRADWNEVCAAAAQLPSPTDADVRAFFAGHFEPLHVVQTGPGGTQSTGLLTGYFEPQLEGSRTRLAAFDTPLYSTPADLLTIDLGALFPELAGKRVRGRLNGRTVVPYFARAELAADPALQGHEIVWVDSPLDAFLLEVQGSGRVHLADGSVIRLGYADHNGQPYHAIGRYLVKQGELTVEQATVPGIRAWLAAHPERLREVLDSNPSVVFFQELPLGDPALGPRGAQGVPLSAGRSIAVDPTYVPLGSPLYLASAGATPLQRLVVAQDIGGAISGAPRADYFFGTGAAAGMLAGSLRQQASLWLLWPRGVPFQNSRQILPK